MGILRKFKRTDHQGLMGANRNNEKLECFLKIGIKKIGNVLPRNLCCFGLRFPCCFLPGLFLRLHTLRDFFFVLLYTGGSFCLCPAADFIHRALPPDTVVGLFGDNGGAV